MTNYALRSMPPRDTTNPEDARASATGRVARAVAPRSGVERCLHPEHLFPRADDPYRPADRQGHEGRSPTRRPRDRRARRMARRGESRSPGRRSSSPRSPCRDFVQSPAFQLVAATGERRKKARSDERTRLRGSLIKFAGVVIIAASLAGTGPTMVDAAFSRSMDLVVAALAN